MASVTWLQGTKKYPVISEIFSAAKQTPFYSLASFLVLLIAPITLAVIIDERTVLDVNVWVKPLKFLIALAVYLYTLAFYSLLMPERAQSSRWFLVFSYVVGFTILAEMLWLISASALGLESHFNRTHPVLMVVYPVMGLFATVLTSASLVIGIQVARPSAIRVAPVVKHAISISLMLTFVLTMITASHMASGKGHFVGIPAPGDQFVPFFGWSRSVGDLRVAHFFSTHALHFIPLLALPLTLFPARRWATWTVWVLSAGYTVFTLCVFYIALSGKPFIS